MCGDLIDASYYIITCIHFIEHVLDVMHHIVVSKDKLRLHYVSSSTNILAPILKIRRTYRIRNC